MNVTQLIVWIASVLLAASPILALFIYTTFSGEMLEDEDPWLEEHIADALHVANS